MIEIMMDLFSRPVWTEWASEYYTYNIYVLFSMWGGEGEQVSLYVIWINRGQLDVQYKFHLRNFLYGIYSVKWMVSPDIVEEMFKAKRVYFNKIKEVDSIPIPLIVTISLYI